VRGEVAIADQTKELGVLTPLLAQLTLSGETLTFEALSPQTAVATGVVARGGAFLVVVKGTQPTLLRACVTATAARPPRPRRRLGEAHITHQAHGQVEQRTLLAVVAPPDLGVPHARRVLRLHRRRVRKRTGEVPTDETAYAIISLSPQQASPGDAPTSPPPASASPAPPPPASAASVSRDFETALRAALPVDRALTRRNASRDPLGRRCCGRRTPAGTGRARSREDGHHGREERGERTCVSMTGSRPA
jgi:hypothetical protein